jgi:uncharacterized membrane protein YccF (DUF307 family)
MDWIVNRGGGAIVNFGQPSVPHLLIDIQNIPVQMSIDSPGSDRSAVARSPNAARGVLLGVAGRAIFLAFGYLASIILARSLGPVDYGTYGVVISVLVWVEQIGRFTFAPAAAKLIPEKPERAIGVEQTAVLLNSFWFLGLFAAFWLAAPLLADILDLPAGTTLFRLAALDLPFFGMYAIYCGVLQGRRDSLFLQRCPGSLCCGETRGCHVAAGDWVLGI